MSGLRRFLLLRHRDPSGVSGTGVVAEGAQFSDGSAALRWHGEHASTTVFESGVKAIVAVHGHGGASEVFYADPADERAQSAPDRPTRRASKTAACRDGLCIGCGGAWPCTRCHPDLAGDS